tara:strand:+ start:223 stop:915 length:693 start_codon:yes stop_codon:yes gene_type:complete
MSKAMVVLSGGQDSTICLHWALINYKEVETISFNYGQKHSLELKSAIKISNLNNVTHTVINVPDILKSRSPLINKNEQLEEYKNYEEMDKIIGDRVELTFVPMRNAFFLTLATNIALSKDIKTLVTGVCQQDNANYPDCRDSFIRSQELTINYALGISDFNIVTPLMFMSKKESIMLAMKMNKCMESLAYSHTCYAGQFPPCGKCHACVLRAQGFKEAGVKDPLIERANK